MAEVGVRELKEKASQIMREVRENRATYTITYQGQPCGILMPYPATGGGKRSKRKGKSGGLANLRGILKGTPSVSFEEFMELKKIWTKHVDELLAEELGKTGEGEKPHDG